MNEWDQCPWFLILSHCLPKLNHFGMSSGWQVMNHCPHATFPEAWWTKPYDGSRIGSLKIWSSPMGFSFLFTKPFNGNVWRAPSRFLLDATCTLPPFPLPLQRVEVQGVSQDLTSTPWAESPQSSWGEGPRFERAGALKKKSPFPFLCRFGVLTEKWSCCLGVSPGERGSWPLFVNGSDLLMNWSLVQCNLSWVVVQGKGFFFFFSVSFFPGCCSGFIGFSEWLFCLIGSWERHEGLF